MLLVELVNNHNSIPTPVEGDRYELYWLLRSADGTATLVARKRYSRGQPYYGGQTLNQVLPPKLGVMHGNLTRLATWTLQREEEPGRELALGFGLRPLDEVELKILGFHPVDPPAPEEEETDLYKSVIELVGDIVGQPEGNEEWEQVKTEAARALRTFAKFL